jgi:dTDP-4-amino-4,6-dideoxygalactose transaminase
MSVDWGGAPVDVEAVMDIGRRHNLKVIVDAAHALGTGHNATPDFMCYSLQAIKHITTIDGGVLLCKDAGDAEVAKRLRWFGIDRSGSGLSSRIEQDIDEWGYKFHMNDVAATIGLVQLDFATGIVDRHQANAGFYERTLSRYFERYFIEHSAYWLYTVLLPTENQRNHFIHMMGEWGIQVSQVHRRNDEYSVFKPFANKSNPGLDEFSSRMACIPVHWNLSQGELELIRDMCNKFARDLS